MGATDCIKEDLSEGTAMLKLRNILLLSLLMTPLMALAEGTERTRSDSEITARVKTALIRDDATKARQINVETENGVVQLSGFVESEQMKAAATTTAQTVSGVQEVRNELIVREGDRSFSRATDDTVIAAKVKTELATDASLATAGDVKVDVRGGVVQLSGFVSSPDQKQQAEQIARRVAGVADVRNAIEVEAPR
jgi:hyperosmotically inducible protein